MRCRSASGRHSIPIPIGQAFSDHLGGDKRFGYIHFDAHIDCQPDVDGERFTNWSHMARMVELPNIDAKNMAVVGVRGATNLPEQWNFVEQHGIHLYRMRDITADGVEAVVADALAKVTDGVDAFYVVGLRRRGRGVPAGDRRSGGRRDDVVGDPPGSRDGRSGEARDDGHRRADPRVRPSELHLAPLGVLLHLPSAGAGRRPADGRGSGCASSSHRTSSKAR